MAATKPLLAHVNVLYYTIVDYLHTFKGGLRLLSGTVHVIFFTQSYQFLYSKNTREKLAINHNSCAHTSVEIKKLMQMTTSVNKKYK